MSKENLKKWNESDKQRKYIIATCALTLLEILCCTILPYVFYRNTNVTNKSVLFYPTLLPLAFSGNAGADFGSMTWLVYIVHFFSPIILFCITLIPLLKSKGLKLVYFLNFVFMIVPMIEMVITLLWCIFALSSTIPGPGLILQFAANIAKIVISIIYAKAVFKKEKTSVQ